MNTSLSEQGLEQARAARAKWEDIPLSAVYCSPLLRARQTADLVLAGRDMELQFDARLVERSFGAYEGRGVDELMQAGYQWDRSFADDEYTMFGIETLGEMKKRIFSFLDELVESGEEEVLIVSHGAIVMLFHLYFHGAPLEWNEMRLDNCQSVLFEYSEGDSQ